MDSDDGNFAIGTIDEILEDKHESEVMEHDCDEDILFSLFNTDIFGEENGNSQNICEINASTSADEALKELAMALEIEHKPPVIVSNPTARFKTISDEELKVMESSRLSKATKTKTKWGVKIFQGTVCKSYSKLSLY